MSAVPTAMCVASGLCRLRGFRRNWSCFAGLRALIVSLFGAASAIGAVEVNPIQLTVDAMLNAPVVLEIDVTAQDDFGEVDLKAEGLRFQREIKRPAPNRRTFLIEPDNSSL